MLNGTTSQTHDSDHIQLTDLAQNGVEMSGDHPVEFALLFPSKQLALACQEDLARDAFDTDVQPVDESPDCEWLCVVRRRIALEQITLHRYRTYFTVVAKLLEGEYIGWGTASVDPCVN